MLEKLNKRIKMESDDDFNLTSDDDDNYAMNTINVNPITDNQHEFEVLGPEDIVKHMSDYIEDVNTIVQISATTTRILLQHFKWDKQKLLEKYFDNDNLENLFHEAHIINPFAQLSVEHKNTTSDLDKCRICFSYCPPDYTTSLKCAHRFCNTCWRIYLSTKIMDDGLGQSISCPGHQCDILVDDVTIMTLITEPCIKFKYQVAITNSFVECNRLWRWCPAVDCKNAVKVQYIDSSPVQCRCGHIFCFECGENWHPSVQCRLLKKWITRYDSTLLWIAVNTKECPKCNVTIIKDGGCNHIECKNQNCAHEFCWVCLDPWQEHVSSSFNCNRYNEEVVKAAQSLTRYNHYNSRYMNHMNSLKFENLLYSAVKAKMEEMQEHNLSAIEEEFLKKSVDMLCLCRRTLMYTYVFAYYLCRNNQSMIFEYNQRDLESATESLSGYLERDITPENLAEIKQKIHHKYGYCESRRKVLLDHVHEGYDKEWWIYTESIK